MKSFFHNTISNSKILNYIKGTDNLQSLWANSIFSMALEWIFNLPCRLLKLLYGRFQQAFEGSVLIRASRFMTDRMHILIGLYLIVTMIIPDHRWHNEYGVYMTILLIMVFVLKAMITPKSSFDIASMDYSAVLFFLTIMMAGLTSLFFRDSINYLIYYFISFLTMIIIISSIQTYDHLNMLIKLICIGTLLTTLYGIYQWKVVGIQVNPAFTDLAISQDLGGRVYSTMGNPNIYGELLVLTIPFFFPLILNEKAIYKKLIWAIMLMPVILILFKTGTRSSWVAFAVSVFIFLFFWNKKLIPIFLILGMLALPFLPAPIYNRIRTIVNPNDKSGLYRKQILNSTISMLKDYWSTGVGLGTRVWNVIFNRYKSFGLTNVAHTHNLFLQIWSEAGIAAILTFFLMGFRMTRNTYAAVRKKENPALNNILATSLSSIAGITAMGLVDHVWFYNRILFMFWIVSAVLFTSLKLINNANAIKTTEKGETKILPPLSSQDS